MEAFAVAAGVVGLAFAGVLAWGVATLRNESKRWRAFASPRMRAGWWEGGVGDWQHPKDEKFPE